MSKAIPLRALERFRRLSSLSVAAALALGAALLLGIWQFGQLPGDGPLTGPLHSAAHFPVFGLLGALVFVALRRFAPPAWQIGWHAYALTLLAMLVLSGITEGSQTFTDRNASLGDVAVNMMGTIAALCMIALYDRQIAYFLHGRWRRRSALLLPVILAILVLLPTAAMWATLIKRDADFPCLVCPENQLDLWMLDGHGAAATLIGDDDTPAPFLEVRLDRGPFPGVTWERPAADWRGFETLVLDLSNPGPEVLALTLRIDDVQHDSRFTDRFNRRITLMPGAQHRACIALPEIENAPRNRTLDLSAIARVMLFGGEPAQGQRFRLHRVWLSAQADAC